MNQTITRIPGVRVGHYTDSVHGTGCTVILFPENTRASVCLRGGAHGTRELTVLEPGKLVPYVHAILLTGGSAFGLASADGVMRWLEEQGTGFPTGVARIPIVPAAVLFDLHVGASDVRPGAVAGYEACRNAGNGPVEMGNAGAGTGATVGKLNGISRAMKGGIGSAVCTIGEGVSVGAIVAVNALGDIVNPVDGRIVAGARSPDDDSFIDAQRSIRQMAEMPGLGGTSTTIGVIATSGFFEREALRQIADMAHDGMARVIRPSHTLMDGDIVFTVSTGSQHLDVNVAGTVAAEVLAEAIVAAVTAAETLFGIPASPLGL